MRLLPNKVRLKSHPFSIRPHLRPRRSNFMKVRFPKIRLWNVEMYIGATTLLFGPPAATGETQWEWDHPGTNILKVRILTF